MMSDTMSETVPWTGQDRTVQHVGCSKTFVLVDWYSPWAVKDCLFRWQCSFWAFSRYSLTVLSETVISSCTFQTQCLRWPHTPTHSDVHLSETRSIRGNILPLDHWYLQYCLVHSLFPYMCDVWDQPVCNQWAQCVSINVRVIYFWAVLRLFNELVSMKKVLISEGIISKLLSVFVELFGNWNCYYLSTSYHIDFSNFDHQNS